MSNENRHQAGAEASKGGEFKAVNRPGSTAALDVERHSNNGLTEPAGWNGEFPLTPASQWCGDRMEGGEHLANPDPVYARCDYAEVGEEGIAYGYKISAELVGGIVAGEMLHDEDDSEYAERVNNALTADDHAAISEFFTTEYGADTSPDGDYGDINVEFYVEYGPEGLNGTSVESMGDRAENETRLLAARNDWEYGGRMQTKLAEALGYSSESVYDSRNNWTGIRWVRETVDA